MGAPLLCRWHTLTARCLKRRTKDRRGRRKCHVRDKVVYRQSADYFQVAAWKHRFSYHCLSQVHDQAFGAKTPNYKTVRELDRKVREYYVPPSLQVPGFGTKAGSGLDQPSIELTMQRYVGFAIKEMSKFLSLCQR